MQNNPDEHIVSNGVWRVKNWIFNSKYGYYHDRYILSEKDYNKLYEPQGYKYRKK